MKIKVKIISKNEFQKWIKSSNTFAKSLIQPQNALKQFNGLSSKQRNRQPNIAKMNPKQETKFPPRIF